MSNDASFVGIIPQHYDQGLGPMIFVDYAADIAQRAAATDRSGLHRHQCRRRQPRQGSP